MSAILTVARTTFRESVRNRTLLAIGLLALAFVASALLLAELALDQRFRVIVDWGTLCVSAFGVGLAILLGVNQVHKEVRRKTLYVVLSRPIARWQYVAGKYLGLSLTLLAEAGALSAALLVLLAADGHAIPSSLGYALMLSLFEMLLVAGFAVFFASFSSPYLSGLFSLGTFVIGRSLPTLSQLIDRVEWPALKAALKGALAILPDLSRFNLSTQAVHDLPIPAEAVWLPLAYGSAYLLLLLVLSAWIFSRRDLT
jgi:ABC-type transport system involved in multi-copper enzyme maturation permease subunit